MNVRRDPVRKFSHLTGRDFESNGYSRVHVFDVGEVFNFLRGAPMGQLASEHELPLEMVRRVRRGGIRLECLWGRGWRKRRRGKVGVLLLKFVGLLILVLVLALTSEQRHFVRSPQKKQKRYEKYISADLVPRHIITWQSGDEKGYLTSEARTERTSVKK